MNSIELLQKQQQFHEIICPINDKTNYTGCLSASQGDNYERERNLRAIALANLRRLSRTLAEYLSSVGSGPWLAFRYVPVAFRRVGTNNTSPIAELISGHSGVLA